MTEFDNKQDRIQALLAERQLDALLLQRVSSFAWATCGAASYVNTATTTGEATLLITPSGRHLITNNIEATRLEGEEKLAEQGWQFHVAPWYEAPGTLARLARGSRLGADGPVPGARDLSHDLARLRANLTPVEGQRFRTLGRLCAEAIDSAVRAVRPGQTEYEISALLAREADRRGAQAIVNLIATDERVFNFRHPLPTGKELERYAMLVLCGRRWGLVCSVTRLVHFGPLPDELRRKAEAVAQVDATFLAATRPGQTLGQVFGRATAAYAECWLSRRMAIAPPGRPGWLRASRVHRHARLSGPCPGRPGLRLEPVRRRIQVGGHHPRHRLGHGGPHRHRRLAGAAGGGRWPGVRAPRDPGGPVTRQGVL